jgi:hypothetical protein
MPALVLLEIHQKLPEFELEKCMELGFFNRISH